VAIGAIEPQFYALLLNLCGITDPAFETQRDARAWPALKSRLAQIFKTKTREQWCALMEGTDACFAPVLDWDEAPKHPHNQARETFIEVQKVVQPAPAPRFSRSRPEKPKPPAQSGAHTEAILSDWGFDRATIDSIKAHGVI